MKKSRVTSERSVVPMYANFANLYHDQSILFLASNIIAIYTLHFSIFDPATPPQTRATREHSFSPGGEEEVAASGIDAPIRGNYVTRVRTRRATSYSHPHEYFRHLFRGGTDGAEGSKARMGGRGWKTEFGVSAANCHVIMITDLPGDHHR
jgi:hypothetical protein